MRTLLLSALHRVVFLAFFFFVSQPAQAMKHVCGWDWAQSLYYEWCIDYDENGKNPDVLYYLHGLGRTPSDWQDAGDNKAIQEEWLRMQVSPPTVISVSFGRMFLLSDIGSFLYPATYPTFVNDVMRQMEARIGGIRGRRLLKGESMGGFNAAQLYLKSGVHFDRVALICPAITTLGPFAPSEVVERELAKSKGAINPKLVNAFRFWTFQAFPSREAWTMHDPLHLVKRLAATSPEVYISAGQQDEFGFYEGARRFAKAAKARGAKVTWHPMPGSHCANDPKEIARFLAPQM